MARKEKNRAGNSGDSGGGGEWIVTFSDCMTLLLCFFVLLLTFSSFDQSALQRFSGAFDFDKLDSMLTRQRDLQESMVQPSVHIVDRARAGSEIPTREFIGDSGKDPQSQWTMENDAYRDRKVINIPSDRLFARNKSELSDRGKGYLASLAGFVRSLPSQMIICETSPPPAYGRITWSRLGLDRAWAVMEYLTAAEGIAPERVSITATRLDGSQKPGDRETLQIVLMAREVYQ